MPQGNLESTTEAGVLAIVAGVHADLEAEVAAHRAALPNATPGELRSAVLGKALFGAGRARMAHAQTLSGRTHVYSSGYRSTALNGRLGAAQTVELPFVFDIADKPRLHGDTGMPGPDPPREPGAVAAALKARCRVAQCPPVGTVRRRAPAVLARISSRCRRLWTDTVTMRTVLA